MQDRIVMMVMTWYDLYIVQSDFCHQFQSTIWLYHQRPWTLKQHLRLDHVVVQSWTSPRHLWSRLVLLRFCCKDCTPVQQRSCERDMRCFPKKTGFEKEKTNPWNACDQVCHNTCKSNDNSPVSKTENEEICHISCHHHAAKHADHEGALHLSKNFASIRIRSHVLKLTERFGKMTEMISRVIHGMVRFRACCDFEASLQEIICVYYHTQHSEVFSLTSSLKNCQVLQPFIFRLITVVRASATRALHTGLKDAIKKPDIARKKIIGTKLGTKAKTITATASLAPFGGWEGGHKYWNGDGKWCVCVCSICIYYITCIVCILYV